MATCPGRASLPPGCATCIASRACRPGYHPSRTAIAFPAERCTFDILILRGSKRRTTIPSLAVSTPPVSGASKVSRVASMATSMVFDSKKSSRKSAHLGWCAAEIKACPSLYFHACLFGSRRRASVSGIRAHSAERILRHDNSATKVHEMRLFSKVDARRARRVVICMCFLADAACIPEGGVVGAEVKIILQNC